MAENPSWFSLARWGFYTVDKDKHLNVHLAFFTLGCCCVKSRYAVPILTVINLLVHGIAMWWAHWAFFEHCELHDLNPLKSPNCNLPWLAFGPNMLSFIAFLYLCLRLVNFIMFHRETYIEDTPVSIMIEWVLYVPLSNFCFLNLIAIFEKLAGHDLPSDIWADKVTTLAVMCMDIFLSLHPIRRMHVPFNLLLFVIYLTLLMIGTAITGVYPYAPMQQLTPGEIMLQMVLYSLMSVAFSVAVWMIHRYNVAGAVGDSLMIQRRTTVVPDMSKVPSHIEKELDGV